MSIQDFKQGETLRGSLVCRNCGFEDIEQFKLEDIPLTCLECNEEEFRPALGLDAERVS